MEERMAAVERKLELLRYPIVRGGGFNELLPPVGFITDFLEAIPEPEVAERARRDFLPIPHRDNREGYFEDHVRYWMSGLEDHDKVMGALVDAPVSGHRLYDFGGSTGRVFRHFFCQERSFEIWSSDFKLGTYRWNQRYLPAELRLFLSTFTPPLPLPDRHFDLITGFSVFTHIDYLESPWLLELRRILKPGGLLYLTIHDETCWEEMSDGLLAAIRKSPDGAGVEMGSPFPGERAAFHFTELSYYSCNVFHSRDYIQREWGRFFDILDLRPKGHDRQCVVLLTYS